MSTVADARATVLTCTMAIYRTTDQPRTPRPMKRPPGITATADRASDEKNLLTPRHRRGPTAPTGPQPSTVSPAPSPPGQTPQTTQRPIPTAPADLTYGRYLRLPDLLAQHTPVSAAHDEHLFITVHQVHELWFQLLLTELADARDRMLTGESHQPRLRLERCRAIEHTLLDTLRLLDTMAPQDFHAFRGALGTASGAQSTQYHEIEILSGRRNAARTRRMGWLTAAERTRLAQRLAEPTLWDGFLHVLATAGHDVSSRRHRHAALTEIARDPAREPLAHLAEALLDHDRAWSRWRSHHALVAERQIGRKPGTGGTPGAAHLRAGLSTRLFPELWESWPHPEQPAP